MLEWLYYARMAIDQRVPKLFWVRPKSELGEHPTTKFVFNISNVLFLKYLR